MCMNRPIPGFHTGYFVGGGGNLGRLMRISIEGPALDFSEVLNQVGYNFDSYTEVTFFF